MKRKEFLKNALMAIAVSLLPKILHPCVPEVVEENMVEVPVDFVVNWNYYPSSEKYEAVSNKIFTMTFKIPGNKVEQFKEYIQGLSSGDTALL